MRNEKKAKEAYALIVEEVSVVYVKPYCDWIKPDFVIVVLFKQGPAVIDTKKVIYFLSLFPSIGTDTQTHSHTYTQEICSGTCTCSSIQTAKCTTILMIEELREKEDESDKQATFAKGLLLMNAVLEKAKKCLEEGGILTIPFFRSTGWKESSTQSSLDES